MMMVMVMTMRMMLMMMMMMLMISSTLVDPILETSWSKVLRSWRMLCEITLPCHHEALGNIGRPKFKARTLLPPSIYLPS